MRKILFTSGGGGGALRNVTNFSPSGYRWSGRAFNPLDEIQLCRIRRCSTERKNMLHAVYHNKGALWKRYIGDRDGSEGNVHAEDEITSTFLGTQVFLETEHVWQIWLAIVGKELFPLNVEQQPESVSIKLWPRRGIEPDAMLTFAWPSGETRHLLMEFKWNSGESGDGQLEKQWDEFLNPDERDNALHLFISKDVGPALTHLGQWPIYPITWHELRSKLQMLPREGKLQTYCDLIDHFLEKIGIHPFSGFSGIPTSPSSNKFTGRIFFAAPQDIKEQQ